MAKNSGGSGGWFVALLSLAGNAVQAKSGTAKNRKIEGLTSERDEAMRLLAVEQMTSGVLRADLGTANAKINEQARQLQEKDRRIKELENQLKRAQDELAQRPAAPPPAN